MEYRIIEEGSYHNYKKGTIVRRLSDEEFKKRKPIWETNEDLFIHEDTVQHLQPNHYEEVMMNPADKIEEILQSLDKNRVHTPAAMPVSTLTLLEATPWVADGAGQSRCVPFSEIFWKPRTVPDHMVREFKGFNADEVMATYVPPVTQFEELSLAFALKLKVNVVGPTGCGKDTVFEYYAAKTGRPYLRIQHDSSFDPAAVFGQVHITGGDTDFVPGTLPMSMAAPTLVTLSELTRSTGASNMVYQRLLDRNVLALPELKDTDKALITPHADWLICASDNTKGNGEDLDKYPMSNVQDGAFLNRWDMVIEADYLSVDQEKALITNLLPSMSKDEVEKLAKLSSLLHAGYHKGDIETAFSPRNLQAITKLVSAGIALRKAIEMNYLTRRSKSEKSDVTECLRAVFGA